MAKLKDRDEKYEKKGDVWELTETVVTEHTKEEIEAQIEVLKKAEIKYEKKIADAESQKDTYERQWAGIIQKITLLKDLIK